MLLGLFRLFMFLSVAFWVQDKEAIPPDQHSGPSLPASIRRTANNMRIVVKTFTGTAIALDVEAGDSIASIKAKIQSLVRIPPDY